MILRMTRQHRNATLGLLVAASLSIYLIVRLVQASSPAPTTVHLTNLGSGAVTILAMSIRGEQALSDSITLPASATANDAPEGRSRTVHIAAGLPIDIQARLDSTPTPLACTLDPRPQGVCVIRARLSGNSGLQCDYECKSESPR